MDKIEFNCSACNSLLRVDREYAGKKARCPKCNMVHDVSGETTASSPGGSLSSHSYDQPTYVHGGKWELRTADGQVYGPVEKSEMDEWATEGRVSPSCYLRQENGDWFPAEQLYASIAGATPAERQPHYVGDDTPYPQSSYSNPYADRTHPATRANPTYNRSLRPHNGATVLVCGILGVFCCGIFGIIAWVVGAKDLAGIKAGEIDPNGQGLVTAGYVMGIIGVLLHGGILLLSCLSEI